MKKKMIKRLSLLVLGLSLLRIGYSKAAQQEEMQKVPTLQMLALIKIGNAVKSGNDHLMKSFEELLSKKEMVFGKSVSDGITHAVARLAVCEYAKSSNEKMPPLNLYKDAHPALTLLIENNRIRYSLSIGDLINAGAQIQISHNTRGESMLNFYNLSLTSLDGLQKIANLLQQFVSLSLSNNQLEVIEQGVLESLPAFKKLRISKNKLRKIERGAFRGLLELEELDCSENLLEEIEEGVLTDLSGLKFLELSKNKLQRIEQGAFTGLLKLEELILSDNQLEVIEEEVLIGLPALEFLEFSSNQLTLESQEILNQLKDSRGISVYFDN